MERGAKDERGEERTWRGKKWSNDEKRERCRDERG